jgi:hypothetical protein
MRTNQILQEIERLPIQSRMWIIEKTLKKIREIKVEIKKIKEHFDERKSDYDIRINAIKNLEESPIEKLFISNSIALTEEKKKCKKIIQLTIAELLAIAIKKIHLEESISILFR